MKSNNKIKKKCIDFIAGARPNFMKIAPLIKEVEKNSDTNLIYRLIHTGQHYDNNMSNVFFKQLNIPEPHYNFNSGGGSQSEQTAKIMIAYEKLLIEKPCDLCVVVGDVNSTLACSIVAKKMKIEVAHVEAGIRSGDLNMPEEINRMVTDSISDYFFTTSITANNNLLNSGIKNESIFFVGNTMIDTLLSNKNQFNQPNFFNRNNLNQKKYIVLTLHRPSNVDDLNYFKNLLNKILDNVGNITVVFPVHPRTKKILDNISLDFNNLVLTDPLPYLEFNYLVSKSLAVITDSGGITEETTFLGIPCITLRDSTERPETVSIGTNELVGSSTKLLKEYLSKLISGNWKKGGIPDLWDGNASKRIIKIIIKKILKDK